MARIAAKLSRKLASPTLEVFRGGLHTTTSVSTTAVAIPTTNLSNRKAIVVQNIHASNTVYLGMCIPDILWGAKAYDPTMDDVTIKTGLRWNASGSGSNEYYLTTTAGADPSLTEPLVIYGVLAASGAETLLTPATLGSLGDHEWDWGGNTGGDALGFNTVYFADSTGSPEDLPYIVLISYTRVPATSGNYGIKLGPNDSLTVSLDGSARLFAIASSSTNIVTLELV